MVEAAEGPSHSRCDAVNIIGILLTVAVIGGVALVLYVPAHVNVCKGFAWFLALSFPLFLFGVAREQGRRNILLVFIYVIANISSLILTFGEIYSQLGLNDSARVGRVYPSIWDGIYFSIITLTTIGYGDITPTLQTRSIAAFEALTGYIIMGLLISVVVIVAQRPSQILSKLPGGLSSNSVYKESDSSPESPRPNPPHGTV